MTITRAEIDKADGKGVRVLVMDSGVEASHPALAGATIKSWQVGTGPYGGLTVLEDSGGDPYGHGTAVCTILHTHAPQAEVHCLRVLDENIRGSSSFVLTGMQWGIEQGYDIINCSFGTGARSFLESYKRVVDKAFCKNTWLVAACNNQDFRTEEYPAFFPTVLATDFGPLEALAIKRREGHLVEFIARGSTVRVAWKNASYRTISGSSFAAPHLAALAARVRQLRPEWNACQAKAAFYELAQKSAEC